MKIQNKVFGSLRQHLILANVIEIMISKKDRTGSNTKVEVVNAVAWISANRKKMRQPR